jgi:hypothetical protein
MCFAEYTLVLGARGVSNFLKIRDGSWRFMVIHGLAFLCTPTPSAAASCSANDRRSTEGEGLIDVRSFNSGTLGAAAVGVWGRDSGADTNAPRRGVALTRGVLAALSGFATTRALLRGVAGLLAAGDARELFSEGDAPLVVVGDMGPSFDRIEGGVKGDTPFARPTARDDITGEHTL